GSSSSCGGGIASREDIENHLLFAFLGASGHESLRLEIEHGEVATALGHELVVRSELDDPAVFEHADPICMAHRREPMRDQDRRALSRGLEDAIEDLGL